MNRRLANPFAREPGFTLVELMVALALAAIISVSIMFISSQARMAYEETVRKVDVYNRFRYVFRTIEEDIKNWLPTSELEFYTDGRGRGARVNQHWDPGEEVPDNAGVKDSLGPGVVDGGVVGEYDEYAQIVQLQYRSTEPLQREAKLHDADQMYFRTFTYVGGAMRLANVEYMLLDPSQADRGKSGIPVVPKQVESKNVADLALYKIVRYYDISPTVIRELTKTPIVRKVMEVCTNVTDFKVEYMVEKDPAGRIHPGFRTPEEEFRSYAEAHVRPKQDLKLGIAGGYRKFFGYGSVKLGQNYSLATAYPGIRADDGLAGQSNPQPLRLGFQGDPTTHFGELIPGDKIFIFTSSERGEMGPGAAAGSAENVSKVTRFPSGDYTVKANSMGLLEFAEDIDTSEWAGKPQSGIYYKASYLPSAVRITMRVVDDQGQYPKTLQRVVWLRKRSR